MSDKELLLGAERQLSPIFSSTLASLLSILVTLWPGDSAGILLSLCLLWEVYLVQVPA